MEEHRLDATIFAIADGNRGIITTEIAASHGIGSQHLARRERRGLLVRLSRGIYSSVPVTREGTLLASVLTAGPGAAVGGMWAAELLRISRFRPGPLEVIAPRHRRGILGSTIVWSSTLTRADVVDVDGLPVTTLPRTLVDCAVRLTPHQVTNLIHQSAFRRLFVRDDVLRCSRSNACRNGNGHATLMRAMQLYASGSAGTRSATEDRYLEAMLRAGAAEPLVNTHAQTPIGGIEADFLWPAARLWVETDGGQHARPHTSIGDQAKAAAMREAGWRPLRFTGHQVWSDLDQVVAQTLRALDGR